VTQVDTIIESHKPAQLWPILAEASPGSVRPVLTASGTQDPAQKFGIPDAKYTAAEELVHLNPATADKEGRQWYSTSKLVNVMWMYALHRRLSRLQGQGKSWAVVMDPGLAPETGLPGGVRCLDALAVE
jgi:hypothetical protein